MTTPNVMMNEGTLYIFDADNTIRVCTSHNSHYPRTIEEQQPIAWMRERLSTIDWSENMFGVATNQGGVAKGEFDELHAAWLVRNAIEGVLSDKHWRRNAPIRVCPHRSAMGCACKKPSPWMLLDIAKSLHVPLAQVVYVGDMSPDRQAATNAGVRFVWAWEFCGKTYEQWQTMIAEMRKQ